MTDVVQGNLGDCYFLAGLAAVADDTPHAIRQSVVDFHDGTYGVRFGNNFYRVDSDLPVASSTSRTPSYAKLGANNSMWVAIMEKAFAHYRKGSNSYASIESGWSVEVNRAVLHPQERNRSSHTAAPSRWAMIFTAVTRVPSRDHRIYRLKEEVLKLRIPPLVMGHQYTSC